MNQEDIKKKVGEKKMKDIERMIKVIQKYPPQNSPQNKPKKYTWKSFK